MAATPIDVGGQRGWSHDEGFATGTFHTFDALAVGDLPPRKVHIFMPRRAATSGRRYRTVYLHDGNTSFWRGGVAHGTWDLAGALARPSADGQHPEPVIVVAIHPLDRNAEYTHVDWSGGRRPWGQLPAYARYVANDLRAFVDAHYPTIADARHRAVVGSSHGGLASFFIATRFPTVFGFAGCMSPSFFSGIEPPPWGPGERPLRQSSLVDDAWSVLTNEALRPRLWMCWGLRRDGGEHNSVVEHLATKRGREMAQLLAQQGYDVHDVHDGDVPRSDATLWSRSDALGGHDERSWGARFPHLMRAFTGGGG